MRFLKGAILLLLLYTQKETLDGWPVLRWYVLDLETKAVCPLSEYPSQSPGEGRGV